MSHPISKARKFVADGIFYAELNHFLAVQLGEDGYSGVEIRTTPDKTEIVIRATRTKSVVGEGALRIRELTAIIQKRFGLKPNSIELLVSAVKRRGLCAIAQAESLKYKLLAGLPVRRACYGVIRFVMESGAKGLEVVVSGKLRGQRAKAMKFRDGYMVKSGHSVIDYVDTAVRHVMLRQGVLGIRVSIMLPHDPTGEFGPSKTLADVIIVHDPKEDSEPQQQTYTRRARPAAAAAAPAEAAPVEAAAPAEASA